MLAKITVVGAGNVGATLAQRLAEKQLAAEVSMVDIIPGLPEGKALDMWESGPIEGFDTKVSGSTDFSLLKGSDIVVVTSGVPRQPGQSRSDLLGVNAKIIKDVAGKVRDLAPNAVVVMVTNPLDVMAHLALKTTGFPKGRLVGMAGILDTARYRTFIHEATGVSMKDITAFVLGGHGDSMVPLPSYTQVAGRPLAEVLTADKVEALVKRTRDGGAEIVKLLQKGSAYYAPSAAVAEMVDAIAKDRKRILPCSAYLDGEYGMSGVYLGVPVVLGRAGVERVVELKLHPQELEALRRSGAEVAKDIEELRRQGFES
ncbi:MAG TPA: malate dehydrogenase [Candidatus Thermoplasmatota archaeon]|nr:malate dehydrogenase [Candidatus Thermoplasmatota archaeon]